MTCMTPGHGQNCGVYTAVNPAAPGLVTPDVEFVRSTFMGGQATINGESVTVWGYNAGYSWNMGGPFPSPPLRVRVGQVVHTVIRSDSMPHTIHHHGIEPATVYDGVGHTSHDVLGSFTYQWRPRHAGTYTYHCHTNTVLHAEMGMYGGVIVDPPEGPGYAADGTPYDVEAVWAVDDIDTNWHCLPWDAGLCGHDVGLNDFNPDLFCITGKGQRELDDDARAWDPAVAVNARPGQTVLLRYVNAGYVWQRAKFHPELGEITIVAEDGRKLPRARVLPAGSEILSSSAERFDIILRPQSSGRRIPVDIDFFDYRTVSGRLKKIGDITGYFNIG